MLQNLASSLSSKQVILMEDFLALRILDVIFKYMAFYYLSYTEVISEQLNISLI